MTKYSSNFQNKEPSILTFIKNVKSAAIFLNEISETNYSSCFCPKISLSTNLMVKLNICDCRSYQFCDNGLGKWNEITHQFFFSFIVIILYKHKVIHEVYISSDCLGKQLNKVLPRNTKCH